MTAPPARCPWAIRFGTLATRCLDDAGHLWALRESGRHIARGVERYPAQRIWWLPGDPREFTTDRPDWYAWEVTP